MTGKLKDLGECATREMVMAPSSDHNSAFDVSAFEAARSAGFTDEEIYEMLGLKPPVGNPEPEPEEGSLVGPAVR